MKRWFEIKARADKGAEVWIYDEIGGFGVSAKEFIKELNALEAERIDLRINSPGGVVFEGAAIYNALKRHPAAITTYVDGLAASIASVVALAGEKVVMAENALFMIHNPWALCVGDAGEMRKTAEILDKVRSIIMNAYMEKSGMSEEELTAAMDAETWYSAREAMEVGFADEVEGRADMAACLKWDLKALGYRRAPEFQAAINDNTEPPKGEAKKEEFAMNEPVEKTPSMGTEVKVMANVNSDAAKIVELAVAHGFADRATGWLSEGKSVEQVAKEILDMKRSAPLASPAPDVPRLTEKEQKNYSLARAIHRAALAREGSGRFDGFEAEVSAEIERRLPATYKPQGGFFVPLTIKSALDTQTATKGAEAVFKEQGELIELLRNTAVISRLGATILTGLSSPIDFPKHTGAMTIHWVGENPATDVAESDISLGMVTLSPKTCQGTTSYSRQLLAQESIGIENLVRNDFIIGHALGWDRAALHGSGASNEPTGLYNVPGVNALAMGGAPTFGKLVDMGTEVAVDNALFGNLGWVTTPGMAGKLMQTLVAPAAGSAMIWQGSHLAGTMAGFGAIASNQVRADLGVGLDEHGMIFGNWSDLVIGMWGVVELIVDPYARKKRGMIEVTSFQMVGMCVRHPESFCKATGAKIA
jgi:HK97 family phage major capsid protein/ATP-dependent Clp endopeptidase proteolytic subunit ClpP